MREGAFQAEDRAGTKLCGRERGERREGRGAAGAWNNKKGTDSGPDRPHQGGVLIQGTMRAADMT